MIYVFLVFILRSIFCTAYAFDVHTVLPRGQFSTNRAEKLLFRSTAAYTYILYIRQK